VGSETDAYSIADMLAVSYHESHTRFTHIAMLCFDLSL